MPLTNPNDYPQTGGVDPRDEDRPFMPKKPPLKVYIKPLTQKIVEKYLWFETLLIVMLVITGISEVFGRTLTPAWYFSLGAIFSAVFMKFIHFEDELHRREIERNKPDANDATTTSPPSK